jgi:hypothetical protein
MMYLLLKLSLDVPFRGNVRSVSWAIREVLHANVVVDMFLFVFGQILRRVEPVESDARVVKPLVLPITEQQGLSQRIGK